MDKWKSKKYGRNLLLLESYFKNFRISKSDHYQWMIDRRYFIQLKTVKIFSWEGGDCLCKCPTWNAEYFLQIQVSMINQGNFVVIFWLVFNNINLENIVVCVVFPIILKIALLFLIHSFGFLIWFQFFQLKNNLLTNWYYHHLNMMK